jgi:hypothetical protein
MGSGIVVQIHKNMNQKPEESCQQSPQTNNISKADKPRSVGIDQNKED